jgi:hypothetical protein
LEQTTHGTARTNKQAQIIPAVKTALWKSIHVIGSGKMPLMSIAKSQDALHNRSDVIEIKHAKINEAGL